MVKTSIFTVIFLAIGLSLAPAQEKGGPRLVFEKEREELGTLYTDALETFEKTIEFTNEGDAPLVLTNVRGCCGTRVTQWPRSPINPGEKGVINIVFRLAQRPHRVNRTVTVTSNDATSPSSIYRMVGEVVERESAPPR
jgi:hypothetical protein